MFKKSRKQLYEEQLAEAIAARRQQFNELGDKVCSFFWDIGPEKGLSAREGQEEMAFEIIEAMKAERHIAVEAGVGIGKTYAYLLPLFYRTLRTRKPAVIATSNISLQEQLVGDIAVLGKMLHIVPRVVNIKGQGHYLCRQRCETVIMNEKDEEIIKLLNKMMESGNELSDWSFNVPDATWDKVNVKGYTGKRCSRCVHATQCKYYTLRRKVRVADGFIICNQDLLTANLKLRNRDLLYGEDFHLTSSQIFNPDLEYIVIDEAHNLESRVRNIYTSEYSLRDIQNLVSVAKRFTSHPGSSLGEKLETLERYLLELFSDFQTQIENADQIAKENKMNIELYSVIPNRQLSKKIEDMLSDITIELSIYSDDRINIDSEIEEIDEARSFFNLFSMEKSSYIFWLQKKGRGQRGIIISGCPKDMGDICKRLYFSDPRFKVIMTSATLTTESTSSGYGYFASTVQLPDSVVLAEPKPSPFNYDEHAMIYYKESMPHPTKQRDEFIAAGTEEIIKLLSITGGKAMILFTSKYDMNEVYEKMQGRVPYKLLIQGKGSSQKEIIEEFKKDVDSVLLGTGSFWEGISIEGKALSNLIIFRLPFPAPDPIIDYKRSQASDHLMEVDVPEMIIKMKQGIGRLIRNETDKGIVSILDHRIGPAYHARYSENLWDALPIKKKTTDLDEIDRFYRMLK